MANKNYILKAGQRYSYIKDGSHTAVIGNGKGTISLTDDQATSFKDKLMGSSKEAVAFEAPMEVTEDLAKADENADADEKPAPKADVKK